MRRIVDNGCGALAPRGHDSHPRGRRSPVPGAGRSQRSGAPRAAVSKARTSPHPAWQQCRSAAMSRAQAVRIAITQPSTSLLAARRRREWCRILPPLPPPQRVTPAAAAPGLSSFLLSVCRPEDGHTFTTNPTSGCYTSTTWEPGRSPTWGAQETRPWARAAVVILKQPLGRAFWSFP